MLTLKSLDVNSFDINSFTLTWEFDPTFELISDYNIDVYRSESPNLGEITDYDHVASGIAATNYSYTDIGVSGLYDPHRSWYYKIKLTDTDTAETNVVPYMPAYVKDISIDKVTKHVLRRKSLALRKYSGRTLKVLKKRSWGTRCTECWDDTLMRVTDDCNTCYGTGWLEGYFTPIEIKGMLSPSPKINQITMFGEWMPSDTLLTMLNFPPLKPRDIIVDDVNKRWIVKNIRTIEKDGFIIEQSAQLNLISQDDLIYTIPVV